MHALDAASHVSAALRACRVPTASLAYRVAGRRMRAACSALAAGLRGPTQADPPRRAPLPPLLGAADLQRADEMRLNKDMETTLVNAAIENIAI